MKHRAYLEPDKCGWTNWLSKIEFESYLENADLAPHRGLELRHRRNEAARKLGDDSAAIFYRSPAIWPSSLETAYWEIATPDNLQSAKGTESIFLTPQSGHAA